MGEPIFKIQHVSKAFGEHVVLDEVSVNIYPGEIIGIIGASGAGKTTFLNTIIGFIKPDFGNVLYRQNHLLSYKNAFIYKSVFKRQQTVKKIYGFASQTPSLYEELTAKENLEYFGLLHNLNKETIKANSTTLLNLMGLEEAKDMKAKNLSGGMLRRLDIACALIHDPDVLILDEPTSDLDPLLRSHIWELVKKINKKGTTIILSSHHLTELEDLCNRVTILKEGKLIATAKPSDLKEQFQMEKKIILQTKPGSYIKLARILTEKKKLKATIQNNSLHILCRNPEKKLASILNLLKKEDEKLTYISVAGASLDDVFISIWQDKKGGKEQ